MYYEVKVKCRNCNFQTHNKEKIKILKGVLVVEEQCTNCGTKSLIKKE